MINRTILHKVMNGGDEVFLVVWLITFIVVVVIFRTVANKFMNFIGADWYTFNPGGRAVTCAIISAVIAFIIYACIYG